MTFEETRNSYLAYRESKLMSKIREQAEEIERLKKELNKIRGNE